MDYETFVIDSCYGLTGKETLRQFPCLFNCDQLQFFVWLGDLPLNLFSKSTLMNLADFAEKQGATSLVLLVDREHPEKVAYKRMFDVIDARRLSSKAVAPLVKADGAPALKQVTSKLAFYEMEL